MSDWVLKVLFSGLRSNDKESAMKKFREEHFRQRLTTNKKAISLRTNMYVQGRGKRHVDND